MKQDLKILSNLVKDHTSRTVYQRRWTVKSTLTHTRPPHTMPYFLLIVLLIATILLGIHHWQIKHCWSLELLFLTSSLPPAPSSYGPHQEATTANKRLSEGTESNPEVKMICSCSQLVNERLGFIIRSPNY